MRNSGRYFYGQLQKEKLAFPNQQVRVDPHGTTVHLVDLTSEQSVAHYNLHQCGVVSCWDSCGPMIFAGTSSGVIVLCYATREKLVPLELPQLSGTERERIERSPAILEASFSQLSARSHVESKSEPILAHHGQRCAHKNRVTSLFFSKEWNVLASTGMDDTLVLWDTNRRIVVHAINLRTTLQTLVAEGRPPFIKVTGTAVRIHPSNGRVYVAVDAKGVLGAGYYVMSFTINGDFLNVVRLPIALPVKSMVAVGPYVFAAQGPAVWVLHQDTLQPHRSIPKLPIPTEDLGVEAGEDFLVLESLAINAFGTQIAAYGTLPVLTKGNQANVERRHFMLRWAVRGMSVMTASAQPDPNASMAATATGSGFIDY